MKYVKPLNEGIRYVDRAGKPFNIKGINFIYTEPGQGNRFYGTSLYDVKKTANVGKRSKIGFDATEALLKSMGIKDSLPMRYDSNQLDKICKLITKKGIICDHGDYMDVS
tara:strand:- start:1925 stop:2254 length:330 start_codon:yes stop_codon:yes gene_type:complete